MEKLEKFIQLDELQSDEFYAIIHEYRKKYILTPYQCTEKVFKNQEEIIDDYIANKRVSELIVFLREASYSEYLVSEKEFVKQVLIAINEKTELPMKQMNSLSHSLSQLKKDDSNEYRNEIETLFGEYTSSIFPYIYELSLSNTQSRHYHPRVI